MACIKRNIQVSDRTYVKLKGSNRTQLWGFSIADFAEVLGESEDKVQRWVRNGDFDPSTLRGIMDGLRGQV